MSGYQPGDEFQCLSIPIRIEKVASIDPKTNTPTLISGFGIVGGIDQDVSKISEVYGFKDAGIYVSRTQPNGPAQMAGLKTGDRILQCNGHDLTLATHKKAVEYIKKYKILELLVERDDECVKV